MHYALNVGLDPTAVADPNNPSAAFPTVTPQEVQAGLDKAADDLATLGLTLENCLLDRGPDAAEAFRRTVLERHYDIIIVGGGIRLEPSMTPLFEKIVNIAREVTPDSILCFNTGPATHLETVKRWWPVGA